MDFEEWQPIYERILRDFGYDPGDDRLPGRDATVAIAGGSDTLEDELATVREADAVFAASTAADVLIGAGLEVDLLVTDLDKTPETAITLSQAGVPVAVHAHGDNIQALRRHLPEFDREQILGTTQAEPTSDVINVGGFTDGDRAAFLADHLGAAPRDDRARADVRALRARTPPGEAPETRVGRTTALHAPGPSGRHLRDSPRSRFAERPILEWGSWRMGS